MVSIPPEQRHQIRQIADNRGLIEAIKAYRRLTGAGLQEAKDAVEKIVHETAIDQPLPVTVSTAMEVSQKVQIMGLIERGRKIDAIKLYRTWTRTGLKEAKDAVEAMERGETVQIPIPEPAFSAPAGGSLDAQIRALLGRKQKIEAVKAYRLATNSGLKEARDYVETIEAQMTPPTPVPSSMQIPLSDDPFAEENTRARRLLFFLFVLAVFAAGIFLIFFLMNGS